MRKIIHIDMDAFYASIEQRDDPSLRGKPIAVGYSGKRGVVAAASYEARRFGVRSAMPSVTALRLCPELIFVPARFDIYRGVSSVVMDIFRSFTDLVEPLSLDEAYLDVTDNKRNIPSATIIAREIKKEILLSTGLTASAGVSYNKFLAKIASDYNKPDGLFVIRPQEAENFISDLPVESFYGVGKVTAEKMRSMGIISGGDLRSVPLEVLVSVFGKAGRSYYNYARGIDQRDVVAQRIRKSLGAENTFTDDKGTLEELGAELEVICEEVWSRMRRRSFSGRTVTLKVKYEDFMQITRSLTLPYAVEGPDKLRDTAFDLLKQIDISFKKVRLLGVTVSNNGTDPGDGTQLKFDF